MKDRDAGKFVTQMDEVIEETQLALKKAAEDMKRFHDVHKGESLNLKPGDNVLVENINIKTRRPMKKLGDKRFGPVEVLKKIGTSAYKLKIPRGWKIHDVFNEVLLTKYHEPEFPSQKKEPPPLPDLIDDQEEFEVEAILGSKKKTPLNVQKKMGYTSGIWYLVRWKGYGPDDDSWVQLENVQNNSWELINEFHEKHPRSAGKKIQRLRMEFPMSIFPKDLFCPMPPPDPQDTEPVDQKLPSEQKLIRIMMQNRD